MADTTALTRYHAASMAAAAMRQKTALTSSPGEFADYTKQACVLQSIAYKAQADYIEALSAMKSIDEKISSLFRAPNSCDVCDLSLIDKALKAEKNGINNGAIASLSSPVLGKAEKILNSLRDSSDSDEIDPTETATARAKDDLGKFLKAFASATDSSFDEIIALCAIKILAYYNSQATTGDTNDAGHLESLSKISSFDDERVLVLFKLIDADGNGCISFNEISDSLLHLMKQDMDPFLKNVWASLLFSGKDDKRKLDFPHFSDLILRAITSSKGQVDFDDICAQLTISACHYQDTHEEGEFSLSEHFRDEELKKILEDMQDIQGTEDEIVSAVQYSKMHKLFDLWDQDHSGTIDFAEFAINLRKFHTPSQRNIAMQDTIDSAMEVMLAIDDDGNQIISRQEFANFLIRFAKAADADLFELIDFMIVRSILRDDNEAELAYLDKVKQRAERKLSWLAPPSITYNPDKWGG